jgi:5S rRNA maturation endonuclease (ribonuclease M5)
MVKRSDAWEEFLEVWEQFRVAANDPSSVIVVEGERDRRSLRRLGVTGQVVLLHSGRGFSQLTRSLSGPGHRIVVLTDWDREGGHLAHRLSELLAAEGALVDGETRRRLARVLRGEVVHVEGLAGWARRMAENAGAPLDHWFRAASD